MKFRTVFFLLSAVFLVSLGYPIVNVIFRSKPAYVTIGSESVFMENATVYRDYAELPMITILEHCGVSVNWHNDKHADISYDNVSFSLSLTPLELIDKRNGNDWLAVPPDNKHYCCKVLEKEILLDDNTLYNIMYQLGVSVDIEVNYFKGEVCIQQRGK